MTVKKLFADLHFGSRELYNMFNELHEEVTDKECSFMQFQLIFSKIQFIKTFFLSASTLNEKQTGVNGLALQTGIWFEDKETLFERNSHSWKEMMMKYFATLYDAMDSQKST